MSTAVKPHAARSVRGVIGGRRQEDAKYVINVKQIAKFVVGLGDKVSESRAFIGAWSSYYLCTGLFAFLCRSRPPTSRKACESGASAANTNRACTHGYSRGTHRGRDKYLRRRSKHVIKTQH
jgi:hypothetical protein